MIDTFYTAIYLFSNLITAYNVKKVKVKMINGTMMLYYFFLYDIDSSLSPIKNVIFYFATL